MKLFWESTVMPALSMSGMLVNPRVGTNGVGEFPPSYKRLNPTGTWMAVEEPAGTYGIVVADEDSNA
jgi:hypothetical protein